MNIKDPVKSIMTQKVTTIELDKSLQKANDILLTHKFRHLPVVENGKLIGILSLTDIRRLSFSQAYGDPELVADNAIFELLSIEQVMNHTPHVVNETDTIESVAQALTKEEFHALPVMNSSNELAGIITTTDIIKHLLHACS